MPDRCVHSFPLDCTKGPQECPAWETDPRRICETFSSLCCNHLDVRVRDKCEGGGDISLFNVDFDETFYYSAVDRTLVGVSTSGPMEGMVACFGHVPQGAPEVCAGEWVHCRDVVPGNAIPRASGARPGAIRRR